MPKRKQGNMDRNKEQLCRILRTSCLSSFIHAIQLLEDEFGDLWGEGKDPDAPLTPQEQKMFNKFSNWRKQVLDFGNLQIREGQSRLIVVLGKIYGQK